MEREAGEVGVHDGDRLLSAGLGVLPADNEFDDCIARSSTSVAVVHGTSTGNAGLEHHRVGARFCQHRSFIHSSECISFRHVQTCRQYTWLQ